MRSRDHFYLPASAQNSEDSEELLKAEESRSICNVIMTLTGSSSIELDTIEKEICNILIVTQMTLRRLQR